MEIIQALQAFASPSLDTIVFWLTNIGSEEAYIVLLIIAFVGINPILGQRLAIALLSSFFLNQQAKAFFDTPRPFFEDSGIARSLEAIETAGGPGFPSGHAQSSLSFWGLAAYYVGRVWFWLIAIIIIAAVALSRIYLGVHFPIDVIGGLLFGLSITICVVILFQELEALKEVPAPLVVFLGLAIPLVIQILFTTPDSGLILGALSAFIVGPALIQHTPSEVVWKRALLTIIAIILAFGALTASSLILNEDIKRSDLGSFLRYFIIGLIGTGFIPYLGRLTGLAKQSNA